MYIQASLAISKTEGVPKKMSYKAGCLKKPVGNNCTTLPKGKFDLVQDSRAFKVAGIYCIRLLLVQYKEGDWTFLLLHC